MDKVRKGQRVVGACYDYRVRGVHPDGQIDCESLEVIYDHDGNATRVVVTFDRAELIRHRGPDRIMHTREVCDRLIRGIPCKI